MNSGACMNLFTLFQQRMPLGCLMMILSQKRLWNIVKMLRLVLMYQVCKSKVQTVVVQKITSKNSNHFFQTLLHSKDIFLQTSRWCCNVCTSSHSSLDLEKNGMYCKQKRKRVFTILVAFVLEFIIVLLKKIQSLWFVIYNDYVSNP